MTFHRGFGFLSQKGIQQQGGIGRTKHCFPAHLGASRKARFTALGARHQRFLWCPSGFHFLSFGNVLPAGLCEG